MTLDTIIILLLVGTIIPVATEILAHQHLSGTVKSLISLVLSTVAGVLTPLENQAHVTWWPDVVSGIVLAFATAGATHYNGWLPLHITGDGGLIQNTLPIGIKAATTPPPAPPAEGNA